jgi:type I restriction enzyme S subunit
VVEPGDVVVNPMWLIEGGVAASNLQGAVSPAYRVYTPAPEAHSRYLHHLLRSRPYIEQYNQFIRGVTTFDRSVSKDDFANLPVLLPPPAEQRRITEFLDGEISRLDALEATRSTQLDLLKEREQSLLDDAFSSCESGVPVRLKHLLANRPRYGVLVPHFVETGTPFIRVNDLSSIEKRADELRMIPKELSDQYARTIVRPGDLLMSVVGSLRRTVIASNAISGANIARAVCSIRVAPDVEVELVQAWLGTSSFLAQDAAATSTDTAQPTLGMEDLSNFHLVWPTAPDERRRLIQRISTGRSSIRELEKQLGRQKHVLAERRIALVTAAVTGQFDVFTASGRNVTEGVTV